jgi:hypothetical protein
MNNSSQLPTLPHTLRRKKNLQNEPIDSRLVWILPGGTMLDLELVVSSREGVMCFASSHRRRWNARPEYPGSWKQILAPAGKVVRDGVDIQLTIGSSWQP